MKIVWIWRVRTVHATWIGCWAELLLFCCRVNHTFYRMKLHHVWSIPAFNNSNSSSNSDYTHARSLKHTVWMWFTIPIAFVQVPVTIYFIAVVCMQLKFSFNKFHTWTIAIAGNLRYDNVHTAWTIAYRSHNTASIHVAITFELRRRNVNSILFCEFPHTTNTSSSSSCNNIIRKYADLCLDFKYFVYFDVSFHTTILSHCICMAEK